MDVTLSVPETQSQQQPQQSSGASGGLQIRSRVTVVCAECKRLKLKCDRRTPCGSCTKRDTVARCIYSPAAAEKVDLHSLNNRLSQVESQLAQFTASGHRCHPHHPKASGSFSPDRALLAVGKSGSSLAISLDDITAVWLDELDLGKDLHPVQELSPQVSCPPYANTSQVKLESPTVTSPGQASACSLELPIPLLLPPMSAYFASQSPSPDDAPCVTSRLVAHLPFAPRKRQRLYDNVEDVLKMHPCFNFKHFKDRAEAMFRWGSEADASDDGPHDGPSSSPGQKSELARAIFFGPPSATPVSASKGPSPAKPTLSFFAAVAAAFALGTLVDREVANEEARIHAAAQTEGVAVDGPSTSRPASRRRAEVLPAQAKKGKNAQKDAASSPSVLLALSQQALALFEKTNPYDLDFLVTMIIHVLYMLHDSKARVAYSLLPDVGKMVNVARTMGLDTDPDEFPGTFNLFDAEARRRLWWDVFYYDLFVSDYMGRSALISDTEHTTRLPMDVDEEVFTPACTSIPLPRSPLSLLEPNVSDFKYFGLKCSLARLVKDVKKRSFKDFLQNDPEAQVHYSLEQAMTCANEVKQWLAELPAAFRLDVDSNLSSSQRDACASSLYPSPSSDGSTASPVLLAQRCELTVTAQRLIMKIYVPFLRPSNSHASATAHYQAVIGVFTAAHTIIRAIRMLCSMWKQRPDLKGRRPTPALFSFYSFGRTLFDAAVVCAHNVIKDPTSVWAQTAMEDVNYALEVMRDPVLNTGRGPMRGGIEGDVHEAIRIVMLLQNKADLARRGKLDTSSSGLKRKRDEPENDLERLPDDFQLPFVGGTVSSTILDSVPSNLTSHSGPCVVVTTNSMQEKDTSLQSEELPKRSTPPVPPSSKRSQTDSRDSKCKDKNTKKSCYPRTGVRIRPIKDAPPFCRLRSTSSSSGTPERNESVLPPSRTPVIPSTPNAEHPPRVPGFMSQSQSAPSPGVREVHHQTATQDLSGETKLDYQVPFVAGDQSGPCLGRVSQPPQYVNSDASDPPPIQKISPGGSTYEQSQSPTNNANPMPYSQPNTDYADPPFTASGSNTHSATQVSRTPSAHNQPTSYMSELPGPPPNYYSFESRYEGNVNNPSLMGLSIHPSMTFHPDSDNAQFSMEIPHHDLPHHQQEKSHPSGYITKPPEHHHHAQRQFSGPQSQAVAHSWQPDGIVPDGFWRTTYDQFMPS